MKTYKIGNIEFLKRGYRGVADRKDLEFKDALVYLSTLGNGWRFPTWNEAMYLIDFFSLGILYNQEFRKSGSTDFYWVAYTGKNCVFPQWLEDGLEEAGTDPYWDLNRPKHLKLTLDTKEDIPWIDDVDPLESAWVLPVRTIKIF